MRSLRGTAFALLVPAVLIAATLPATAAVGQDIAVAASAAPTMLAGTSTEVSAQPLLYTVFVTNQGVAVSGAVSVRVTSLGAATLLACQAPGGTCAAVATFATAEYEGIAPGEARVLQVAARPTGGPGDAGFSVLATAADDPIGNNSAVVPVPVLLIDPERSRAIDTSGARTPIVSTRGHFRLQAHENEGPAGTLVAGETPTRYDVTSDVPGHGSTPCVGEIVVYVHGYFNDTQFAISNFNLAKRSLAANEHPRTVVGFSWDSNPSFVDPLDPVRASANNFGIAEEIATQNGAKLAQFLLTYRTRCPSGLVRLIAHSLGARVVLNALEQLRRHNDGEPTPLVRTPANTGRRIEVASVHLLGGAVNNEEIALSASSGSPTGPQPTFGRAIESVSCEFHNKYDPLDNVLTVFFSADRILSGYVNVALGLVGAESGIERPANFHQEDVSSEISEVDQDGEPGPDPDPAVSVFGLGLRLTAGHNHSGYAGVERPRPGVAYDDGAIDLLVADWKRQLFSAGCLKNLSGNDGSSGFQDVAATGERVHVVWEDRSGGNFDVLLRTSRDGGASFGRTVNLSENAGASRFPRVAVSGTNVYVAWSDNTRHLATAPINADILVRASGDGGATFGPTIRVSEGDRGHGNARIAADGADAYVAWSSNSMLVLGGLSTYGEVYARSVATTGALGPLIDVSETPRGFSDLPDIAAADGVAHVVWQEDGLFPDTSGVTRGGEIWYRAIAPTTRAKDNMSSALSATSNSVQAKVAAAAGDVYVLWNDDAPGNYDTFVRIRRSGEPAFGAPLNVSDTPGHSFGAEIALDTATSNRDAYVAWSDGTRHDPPAAIGSREVYVRPIRLAGASLGAAVNVSANAALSIDPEIAASGGNVYVAWADRANGNYDTHFRASLDRGVNFLPETPARALDLSANDGDTWVVSVAAAGERFYAAWTDFTPGGADVLFRSGVATTFAPFAGRIVMRTPDRGDLPLRRAQVDLVHGAGTFTTYTDDDGRYRAPLPPGSTAYLRVTLLDADAVIAVHHVEVDQAASIETPTFRLASGRGDIVLRPDALGLVPQLALNGVGFTPAATTLKGGLARAGDFPHLAAIYHYALIASDFMRTRLPGMFVDSALPLEIVGFSALLDAGSTPAATLLEPEPSIHIRTRGDPPGTPGGDPGGSAMADSQRTEQEIDTLFHEFGHYVELEARLGGENTRAARDRRLHGALAEKLDADCHQGYAQIDSSCAWSEGFATFIGSVITHTALVDAAHAGLRANAGVDALPGGVVWPLDPPTSIVGPRLGEGGLHMLSQLAEELAVAGLLWDLVDSGAGDDDAFAIPLGELWGALNAPENNSTNGEIITTLRDLYTVLVTSGLVEAAAIEDHFRRFDICADNDRDLDCDAADPAIGGTAWSVAFLEGGPPVFSFRSAGRWTPQFIQKQGIGVALTDELGRRVDGATMTVRLRYPDGSEQAGTVDLERGAQVVGFLMPHPAQATLTFTKPGHASATAVVDSAAYWAGATDRARTYALDVAATMARLVNAPPRAGAFSGTADEDTIVSLTLRGADDDMDPLTFRIVTPPSVGTLTAPAQNDETSETVEYTPPADHVGNVRFTYLANDGRVDSAPETVELTFGAVADDPSAHAGPDQEVLPGATVQLDGSATHDADGDAVSLSWTQLAGPTVALSSPASRTPTFTAPSAPGTLLLELEATDASGRSAIDVVAVTVRAIAAVAGPVADAGTDTVVDEGSPVTLDGTTSSDPEGAALSFMWTQVAGPPVALTGASTSRPSFIAPAVDAHAVLSFELIVRARGLEARDVVSVVVRTASSTGPVANAGGDRTAFSGATIVLDGSASTGAPPLAFAWTQIAGEPVTIANPSAATTSFVAPLPADTVLAFRVVVTDGAGATATDAVTIVLRPAIERDPVADAGEDRAVGPGDVVTLDGTASRDDDGDPLTFRWSQLAGPPAELDSVTAPRPTLTVPAATAGSVFTFLLSVTDGRGGSAIDVVNLIMPPLPPSHMFDPSIDLSESPSVPSDVGGASARGQLVASGDAVHIVFGEGNALVYRRSTDAGRTFGAPITLVDPAGGGAFVSQLVVAGDGVYVAWFDRSLGNAEVFVRRSADGGVSFGPAVNVSEDAASSSAPRVAVSGPRVHVAWHGPTEVYVRTSADGGATFGPRTTLSRPFTESSATAIGASGSRVHVLMHECSSQCSVFGAKETLLRTSTDDGSTYAEPVLLSDLAARPPCVTCVPQSSVFKSLAVVGDTVHVTWIELEIPLHGQGVLVHRRSTDGGATFAPPTDVAINVANHRLAVAGSSVYVVYHAFDVFLRRSPDAGATFGPVVNISAPSGAGGVFPKIAVADDAVHVAWKGGDFPSNALMWRASTDGGASFAAPATLGDMASEQALLAAAGANVYVAWDDVTGRTVPDVMFRRGTELPPGDLAPVADAGPDRAADEGAIVSLDATASSDPEGAPLTYLWEQIVGPAVTIAEPSEARTTFTAPTVSADAVVVLRLVVSDGSRASTPDALTILVREIADAGDLPPLADAGPDRVAAEGSAITLDGSASSDPENGSLEFQWTQLAGPPIAFDDASDAAPTATLPAVDADTFVTVQLVVSDGTTWSAPDALTILVRDASAPANGAPIADAGADQSVTAGATVTLRGGGSMDPDGDALSYSWTQLAGPSVTLSTPASPEPSFTATASGVLVFALTVSDGRAASVPDAVAIAVQSADGGVALPIADAGGDQRVDEGEATTLDGTLSSPARGGTLTYAWRQVAGPAGTLAGAASATASVTTPLVSADAVLVFELVVAEAGVSSAPDRVAVLVTDTSANAAPVANAGADRTIDVGATAVLDGTASADPEGRALTYTWTQIEGPAVALSGERLADPRFLAPASAAGATLAFELVVSDGNFDSAPDRVSVAVRASAQGRPPVANAGDDRTVVRGASVTIDGSLSGDPDGDPLTFGWAQVAGPAVVLAGAATSAPTFGTASLAGPAVLAFELTVSDGRSTAADAVIVNVTVAGAPRAWIGHLPGPVEGIAGSIGLALYLVAYVADRPPAFDVPPSPPDGSSVTVVAGDALALVARCSDPDGDPVFIRTTDAPPDAQFALDPTTPVTATLTWTTSVPQQATVAFVCQDIHGATAGLAVQLEVRSADDLKRDVIAALAPHAGSKGFAKDVADAIDDIRRSLTAAYWKDATHLEPKHGHRVFADERDAARELENVAGAADASTPVRDIARAAAERLVEIDRVLALLQMRDALTLVPQDANDRRHADGHNTKAAAAFAEGDRLRDEGRLSHAIARYREAWHHAMDVIEQPRADHIDAEPTFDDPPRTDPRASPSRGPASR